MGANMHSRQLYEDQGLKAGTLPLLKTKGKYHFAVARILGLGGRIMGPVTGLDCGVTQKVAADASNVSPSYLLHHSPRITEGRLMDSSSFNMTYAPTPASTLYA